jgi:hypothetical protein
MARKCIRKLMVVIIVLNILIVVKIQVNSLASTSFAPPIHISEFDKSPEPELKPELQKPTGEEQFQKMHACLMKRYEHCKKKTMRAGEIKIVGSAFYGLCLINGFNTCLKLHNKGEFGVLARPGKLHKGFLGN